MARLSISEAARQAGISRQYLHKKYISSGKLSVNKDEQGKPYVDSSELARVFDGRLPGPLKEVAGVAPIVTSSSLQEMTDGLLAQLQSYREQLAKSEEREKWLQGQVESLTGTVKLLQQSVTSTKRGFWSRLIGRG
jgi:hypothetical protein